LIQVCKKHQEKPVKNFSQCVCCELEMLHARIRELEESQSREIDRFLTQMRIMSGTGNGIGRATVEKIRQFAIREGFLIRPAPQPEPEGGIEQ